MIFEELLAQVITDVRPPKDRCHLGEYVLRLGEYGAGRSLYRRRNVPLVARLVNQQAQRREMQRVVVRLRG